MSGQPWGLSGRRFAVAVGILGGIHLILCLVRLFLLSDFPFNADSNEGYMMTYLALARAGNWYPDIHQYPYLWVHYPPLGIWLLSQTVGRMDPMELLPVGRWAAWLAYSAVALLFAGAVNRSIPDRSRIRFWMMVAAVVSTLHYYYFSTLFLMDPFAIAATWGALYCVSNDRWRFGWIGAALLFLAAYQIKHTQITAPAAVMAWLWFKGDRRALPYTALLLVGVAIFEIGLGALGLHVDNRVHSPMAIFYGDIYEQLSAPLGAYFLSRMISWYPWIALMCIAAAWKSRRLPKTIWGWYALATTPAAILLMLRIGGNFNLLSEWLLAMLALAIVWVVQMPVPRRKFWLAMGLLQMIWTLRIPTHEGELFMMKTPDAEIVQARWDLFSALEKIKGPILCYADYDWCHLTGRTPPLNLHPIPAYVRNGWDPLPLQRMVERAEFGAIVFQFDAEVFDKDPMRGYLVPEGIWNAFRAHYRPAGKYYEDWLYLPIEEPEGG